MTARDMEMILQEALYEAQSNEDCDTLDMVNTIGTFEEMGMLTMDRGLIVTLNDGSEFQVTIVQRQ